LNQFPASEIQGFQDQLKEIEQSFKQKRLPVDNENEPAGEDLIAELLNHCLQWADIVLERSDAITWTL
jgi:hypothetical protein